MHLPEEASEAAKVCDIIPAPAFLARQTSLIEALAKTNCLINIKKPQFSSPEQVKNIVEKFYYLGKRFALM